MRARSSGPQGIPSGDCSHCTLATSTQYTAGSRENVSYKLIIAMDGARISRPWVDMKVRTQHQSNNIPPMRQLAQANVVLLVIGRMDTWR